MPRDAPETAMDSEVHVQLLNFYIISRLKKETTLCPFVILNGNKFSVAPALHPSNWRPQPSSSRAKNIHISIIE